MAAMEDFTVPEAPPNPKIDSEKYPNPLNMSRYVEDNKHRLVPPVGNICMMGSGSGNKQFTVMIIGGPNERTDYHLNEGDEFFWQLKGDMVLKVVDGGIFRDIPIKEGECFLLPARVPHSPQRYKDTIGLVIERDRHHWMDELDGMRWYCSDCRRIVYEMFFHCTDLGAQLGPVIKGYYGSETARTCKYCGTTDTRVTEMRKDDGVSVHEDILPMHKNRFIDYDKFRAPQSMNKWIEANATAAGAQKLMCGPTDFEIEFRTGGHEVEEKTFSVSESCEFYHMLKGAMKLTVKDGECFEDISIGPGEVYMLPPYISHSEARNEDSLGLVVSRKPVKSKVKTEMDKLQWFCTNCKTLIYEESFFRTPDAKQGIDIISKYYSKERKCDKCGCVDKLSTAH
eukprot:270924_1